jgi:heptaprenyl diphosphate synthase/octaprenyl-diphosphate synthase
MTGAAAPHQVEAVSEWGWEMGLVFQMTDDVLDLVADEAFLGKPAGSDMLEGTYTLPVLYAVAGPAGPEIRDLLARGRPDPATVARLLDIVRSGGYVDRVLDEALERARVAEKAVARAATGQLVDVFANLDRYLLDRVEAARRR